ncbi:LuxR C-terminal-related transcriptional regulator [Serratia ureilytica]|uniref:response regulator transcription factor n=1 Tax=Serratia ureilytica TaxID=300181 RepID=UPI000B8E46F4|nr:LuxR C-terminal-related transcriptional regulator [Serratia ureilytica]MEB5992010.1 LuxR C-terminal-related transcriptional regulator [Serratia ureilytica]
MSDMRRSVLVAIIDGNHFFASGLQQGIQAHFQAKGRQVHFVSEALLGHADLVFQQITVVKRGDFCRQIQGDWSRRPLFFSIQESVRRKRDAPYPDNHERCVQEAGEVYRNEPLRVVMQRIDAAMAARVKPVRLHHGYCACCWRKILTMRERQVLRCLSLSGSLTVVAQVLKLSLKSISMYKRSAMSKLGVRNNVELYHWLRQGGLEIHRR